MKPFPSIEQFRHVIRKVRQDHDYRGLDSFTGTHVYQHISNYPTLPFRGTVKLHGTNAAIVFYKDRTEYQSRERVLTLEQDNTGFMAAMTAKDLSILRDQFDFNDHLAVYGEWCGKGIQKGVAISSLEKMFVIFAIKVDGEWRGIPPFSNPNQSIYNILQFRTFHVNIDFNNPEAIQNQLIDLTLEVENECPVGLAFGTHGVGEGIVFTCLTNQDYIFKSKGEKHSVSRVKKLNPIDVELMSNIQEFVDSVVTDNRLDQGINYLKERGVVPSSKDTGEFLSWVVRDVLKEESDTLVASGLDGKKVKAAIVTKARMWYLNNTI